MKKGIKKPGDIMSLAVLSWMHVPLLFSGCYLLLAGILRFSYAQARAYLAGALWLLLPAVLSWVFIRRIRTLIAYLLASAAATALIRALGASVLTSVLSAVIFLLRGYVRIKKGRIARAMREMTGDTGAQLSKELWEIPTLLDRPHPIHWIVFAVCYIGILCTGRYFLLRWMFFLLLAEVFLCFVYSYLDSMWTFIRENRKIANLPVKALQKVGRVLLILSSVFLALALLPSVLYGREPLVDVIENFHPQPLAPSDWEQILEASGGQADGMDLDALAGEIQDPPAWLDALSDLLMYAAAVVSACVLLIVVYRLCRNASRYFAQEEEDEIVFLREEEQEALSRGRLFRRGHTEKRRSPNQRIRRFYKKVLRRRLPGRPSGWETPRELEQKAALSEEESALLHSLYEKARYSREGCTEEEAQGLSYSDFIMR